MKKIFQDGGLYHIFNRGNNKERIFRDSQDYEVLLKKIFGRITTTGDRILSYNILPNHFHFIMRANHADTIPKLMQSFGLSYSHYYRRKYDYVGHIFQGPYKAKHVDSIPYLLTLSKYIHRNPYKAGLVPSTDYLHQYKYSSYRLYLNPPLEKVEWEVDEVPVLSYFESSESYKEYVEDDSKFSLYKYVDSRVLLQYIGEKIDQDINGFISDPNSIEAEVKKD